jgi:dTDP-4-dehydrorhamnose reductase
MTIKKIPLWGGVECTVNRVADSYHQQLPRNGHLGRVQDIDAFAALGFSGLRVPILWELAETARGQYDLSPFDPMLERVRKHGLRAIAGLVHHGSGPLWTSLLDPQFEHGLARYASEVAARYPWILDYTPINEPLTTARFSGLYGYWYPHARDNASFVRALLNETRATVRAMEAIRRLQPSARLVQTEDIAHVTSSDALRYEAEYQNQRRWLSFDLLCGRVDRHHPLYSFLLQSGAQEDELSWLCDHPCPPDIIGANYYFTSDRHLDERVESYPEWSYMHNGRHAHADVHASAFAAGMIGHRAMLQAIWDRYQLPIAITEVHAGSTREEQLRWLKEAWDASLDARAAGIDVRAITAWALLGSFDWNQLVTVERGYYESGVFDVRGERPRPTALAKMIADLSETGEHHHPVLDCQGWWRRPLDSQGRPMAGARSVRGKARPLLITGASGTLGRAFARACAQRGLAYETLDRSQLDVTVQSEVDAALTAIRPWAVINAAGFMQVDLAEAEVSRCLRANVEGPVALARACARGSAALLTFSSDLVFDGRQTAPYLESAPVAPLSQYGRSKVEAERRVLQELPRALVVRTGTYFGPDHQACFLSSVERALRSGQRFRAAHDSIISPTYLPHLADACLDLLIDDEAGVWHVANRGEVSWAELASRVARLVGLPAELIDPCALHELGPRAARPLYRVLGSARGQLMPSLEEGLIRHFQQRALAKSA